MKSQQTCIINTNALVGPLEIELSGCNKEVAALHSDHYMQVQLYIILHSIPLKGGVSTSLLQVHCTLERFPHVYVHVYEHLISYPEP